MDDNAAAAARASAKRLAGTLGAGLEADVESLLAEAAPRPPDQYIDPISLGSLIVAVATFAWTVYSDIKTKDGSPKPDHVARSVRVELRAAQGVAPDQVNTIVEVVVDEVFIAGGGSR